MKGSPVLNHIEGIYYFKKGVVKPDYAIHIPISAKLELRKSQNTFMIVLNYNGTDSSPKAYRYTLENDKDVWFHATSDSSVLFRDITPGEYRLSGVFLYIG